MILYEGEHPVQHNQQLGQPGEGGAHLSVLWKKLSLESCLGETHTEAARGIEQCGGKAMALKILKRAVK